MKTPNVISSQKDFFSINSNMGSIESSVKSETSRFGKLLKKELEIKKSITQSSGKKQDIVVKAQTEVVQWQAVYIEGKFYLSDKQTVQRYFQIETLLEEQRKLKSKMTKASPIRKQNGHGSSRQDSNKIKWNQRIQNLQTIRVINECQSQKQKQEDESLLNNLNTSLQQGSRFTLNSRTYENGQRQVRRIASISSIQSEAQIQQQTKMYTQKNNLYNKKDSISAKQSSQQNNTVIVKSLPNDQNYGYYLTANNTKIYSRKDQNHNFQYLKSLHESDSSRIQDQSESNPESSEESKHKQNKPFSLAEQQKIQPPINPQTNRLKIGSMIESQSSFSKIKKIGSLHKITEEKITEEKQEDGKRIPITLNFVEKNDKKFVSLPSNNKHGKQIYKAHASKTYQKNYSDQKLVQKKLERQQNNSTIFSNFENVDLVQSSETTQNLFDTSRKQPTFRTTQMLQKLSTRKQLSHRSHSRNAPRSKFDFTARNNLIQFSTKYQLPQINLKQHNSHQPQKYTSSIEQQYYSIEKQQQRKLFSQAQLPKSSMSKTKNRPIGFIKNLKNDGKEHHSAFQIGQNQKNIQMEVFQEQNQSIESIKKINKSIKVESNHQQSKDGGLKSSQQNKGPKANQQNLNRKSLQNIGKIFHNPERMMQRQMAQSNNSLGLYSNIKTMKDAVVTVNLKSQMGPNELNPEFSQLRQTKEELLGKLSKLERQDLQQEIKQIKSSIRNLQIQRLNKLSKTIDFSENQQGTMTQSQKTKKYKEHLNKILNIMPQDIRNIDNSLDIAHINIPQQLLNNRQGYSISPHMSPEQLQQVAIRVYKIFGIINDPQISLSPSLLTTLQKPELTLKQKEKILIKKFKNCLFVDIVEGINSKIQNKTIIWDFQTASVISAKPIAQKISKFYIGGWSSINDRSANSQKEKTQGKGNKNGFGMEINDKYVYEGQYLNGKKHGFGKIHIISSKYRYEGQFIENQQSGHGKQYNPIKGQIYVGQFKNGKRHGKGYLKKLSQKQRKQKLQKPNQFKFAYFFDGTFSNGTKQSGHEFFQTGDEYKGEYMNEMFQGKGSFRWFNGSQYEGEFHQNTREGFGKWSSFPDPQTNHQAFYIGEFKNSMKHGQGKYIYKNGSYYQGSFQNDIKHGLGALFYQGENNQNKVLRGYWTNGNIAANEKGQIYKMKMQI